MERQILQFENEKEFAAAAAKAVAYQAAASIDEKGAFSFAISGGTTPRFLFSLLSQPPYSGTLPWEKIHFFWCDERFVPQSHADSNYKTAFDLLLSKVKLPSSNIHSVPVHEKTVQAAAESYEADLRAYFKGCNLPEFDLVLLGMGADGHAASLFKGDAALKEKKRWVAAVENGPIAPHHARITLTLPAINNSRSAFFLISGEDKAKLATEKEGRLPAQLVSPKESLVWFILTRK